MTQDLRSPPPVDPEALLAGIRGFLTGNRTIQGYGLFADWVRELDRQLTLGTAAVPAGWQHGERFAVTAIAEQARRWREEAARRWRERVAGPVARETLEDCATDVESILRATGTADGSDLDPAELISVALALLGRAREALA